MSARKFGKTDRIIICVAFLFFAVSLSLLLSDYSLFQSTDRYRGTPIGYIAIKNGDVRFKSAETIVWRNPNKHQNIIYNDAVFVGADSTATAKIGDSQLEINQNSLVVFRKEQEANFLNMNYGELWGKLAKGDKIIIDNGKGAPIEITAQQKSEVVFKKSAKGKTEIHLNSGNAKIDINGKKVRLKPNAILRGSIDSNELQTPTPELISEDTSDAASKVSVVIEIPKVEEVLEVPLIYKPSPNDEIIRDNFETEVTLEFRKPLKAEYIWYQIYSAENGLENLEEPLVNGSHISGDLSTLLVDGRYAVRAASVYPQKRQSEWSEYVEFSVKTELPELPVIPLTQNPHVLIPNKVYPSSAYAMSDFDVAKYLSGSHSQLKNYFRTLQGHQVEVAYRGKRLIAPNNQLPYALVYPGRRYFQYQLSKENHKTSAWSRPQLLEVVLEPPRKLSSELAKTPTPESETALVNVEITPLLFAHKYEIELRSQNREPESLISYSPSAQLSLLPNTNYTWRARALNKKGVPISSYSAAHEEYVPFVNVVVPTMAEEAPVEEERAIASTEELDFSTSTEKLEPPSPVYDASGFFAWVGSGYNYTNYKQRVESVGAFDDNNLAGPSMYAEVGYRGPKGYGGLISYKNTPGEVRLMDTSLVGTKYQWTTISLEGLFEKTAKNGFLNSSFTYGLRAGAQKHELPYIHQLAVNDLSLRKIDMQTASLGFLTKLRRDRLSYHWSMRYQYPISASAAGIEGFDVKTKFAFDGLLGMTYHLSEQWMLGWFWYGQWHEYDLKYIQNNNLLTGSQSLFYSNMDFRLGFDF